MKKSISYFNFQERNGLFLLCFLLVLFCVFLFVQKRVVPEKTEISILHTAVQEEQNRTEYTKPHYKKQNKYARKSTRSYPNKNKWKQQQQGTSTSWEKSDKKQGNKYKSSAYKKAKTTGTFKQKYSKQYKNKYAKSNKQRTYYPRKKNNFSAFSINSQNPDTWSQIYGIGPKFAARIVKFQSWLGGFSSKEQIKEVYGISDSLYQTFQHKLIDAKPYKKLKINSISQKSLSRHPYINWKTARALIRYRKHNYPVTVEKFMALEVLTEKQKAQISPYMDFSIQSDSLATQSSLASSTINIKPTIDE